MQNSQVVNMEIKLDITNYDLKIEFREDLEERAMTGPAHEPAVHDCSGQGEPPYAADTLNIFILAKQEELSTWEAKPI